MATRKIVGIILLVLGVVGLAAFLLVDFVGLGHPGFGLRQTVGTIVGGAAVVVGIVLLVVKK